MFEGIEVGLGYSEAIDRALLMEFLQGLGCRVVDLYQNGIQPADCYVLDVGGTFRFGDDVLRAKAGSEVFLPVALVLDARENATSWLEAGFDVALRQPLSKDDLAAHLKVLTRLRRHSIEMAESGEMRYRAVFEASATALLLVSEDGTVLMANAQAALLTGRGQLELVGARWFEFLDASGAAQVRRRLAALRRGQEGSGEVFEARLTDAQGRVRSVGISLGLMPDGREIIVSLLDLTPQIAALKALAESEVLFRSLFEDNTAPMLLVHPRSMRIIDANPVACEFFGWPRERMRAMETPELTVSPVGAAEIKEFGRRETGRFETQVRLADGTIRHVSIYASLIGPPRRRVRLAIIHDITARKQAEAALRESEERFRQITDLISDYAYELRVTPDRSAQIEWVSESFSKTIGYTIEEMKQMGGWIEIIHPEDRARMRRHSVRVLGGQNDVCEARMIAKDGTWRWVRDYAAAVRDEESGLVTRIYGAAQDITRDRQAELERERLITAIEQTDDMIVVTDSEGKILYVNKAVEVLTGFRKHELPGRQAGLLLSKELDERVLRELGDQLVKGVTWSGRIVCQREGGSTFPADAAISPVRDSAGNTVGFVAVGRDESEKLKYLEEQSRLQQQLHRAQRLESLGRLAGGVAHDFNNMLTVILGYGASVLERLHPTEPARREVEEIVRAGQRSADLTRQLLAFGRRQPLQPEVISLNDGICNLHRMLLRLVGEDVEVALDLTEDLPSVRIDPVQFEQVVMNLVVNARDAMAKGGRLTIRTALAELGDVPAGVQGTNHGLDWVVLTVADTGCGMDQQTLERIFDPFFTTKEQGKGTGLGLSTVYGIVKQSGGAIDVSSEVNCGTTFRIFFPATAGRAVPRKTVASAGPGVEGRGEQILVVEDESALRGLLEAFLTRLGYRVIPVANGGEAILQVEENGLRPALVLSDVIMPGLSGPDLVRRLKSSIPGLKVLFMSGYSDGVMVEHGFEDLCAGFVQKPFDLNQIAAKVRDALDA
ncbi:MAG: PAS domain S-box protein [Acidobacteriota bacterium]